MVGLLHTQVILPCHFDCSPCEIGRNIWRRKWPNSSTFLKMLQASRTVCYLSLKRCCYWRRNDWETNMDCGPDVVQRDNADHFEPKCSFGLDQYSREIMHVRQSYGSRVSSFDVITEHLVRFLVTSYIKHGEVSHRICCYYWDEHRQWSICLSEKLLLWMCYWIRRSCKVEL